VLNKAVTIEPASKATTVVSNIAGAFNKINKIKQGIPNTTDRIKISLGCFFKNVINTRVDLERIPLACILR
jgi:hypothetical protein